MQIPKNVKFTSLGREVDQVGLVEQTGYEFFT
jgi:hypothetical protein